MPLLLFLLPWGCSGHDGGNSQEEEEAIFALVNEPGAEGLYDEVVGKADSLLLHARMSDTLRGYVMIEKGVALYNWGRIPEAVAFADTIVGYGSRIGFSPAVVQGEQLRGGGMRRMEKYDSAFAAYSRAMEIVVREKDYENERVLAELLAITCRELGRNSEAGGYARKAMDLAVQMEDTVAMFSAVSILGSVKAGDGQYSETIRLLTPYTDIADSFPPSGQIKLYTPLVKAYTALDSLVAAHRVLGLMKTAAEELPAGHQASVATFLAEAELFGREGRWKEKWNLLCGLDSLDGVGMASEKRLVTRAECLAAMGHGDAAYHEMLAAYDTVTASRRADIDAALSSLSVRYGALEKEMRIMELERRNLRYLSLALGSLLLLLAGVVAVAWMRRRARRKAELEKHAEYIRGLEQERARMARELHDGIAGDLVALQLTTGRNSAVENAASIREIASRVRRLSHELMPPGFAEVTFVASLRDMVGKYSTLHSGVRITVTRNGTFSWDSLPVETAHELYRMVQECIANALKHSRPTSVDVLLSGDRTFRLLVVNDGVGTDIENDDGIGLRTLKARADIIHASVSVERDMDKGVFSIEITQNDKHGY